MTTDITVMLRDGCAGHPIEHQTILRKAANMIDFYEAEAEAHALRANRLARHLDEANERCSQVSAALVEARRAAARGEK